VPCLQAPEEADPQCAFLSKLNLVDYVATEDMDLLTFGSKILLKNFMKRGMYKVTLDDILKDGKITMDQFIDICILLGCDYTDTIDGIGPKRAWDLIKKYGSIEELISQEKKIINNDYKLPDNFRYVEAREYFKNPRHIEVSDTDLELKIPKLNELKELLVTKYGFKEDNIENLIGFLRKKHNIRDEKYEKVNDDPFIEEASGELNTPKVKI
jgi:flap endonuclease-1